MTDSDFRVRILCDALTFGDRATVKRHGISVRTLQRYRAKMATDPAMACAVAEKAKALDAAWLETGKRARLRFIARMEELAETETDLHKVSGAFKLLSDAMLASEILNPAGGDDAAPAPAPAAISETDGRWRR